MSYLVEQPPYCDLLRLSLGPGDLCAWTHLFLAVKAVFKAVSVLFAAPSPSFASQDSLAAAKEGGGAFLFASLLFAAPSPSFRKVEGLFYLQVAGPLSPF